MLIEIAVDRRQRDCGVKRGRNFQLRERAEVIHYSGEVHDTGMLLRVVGHAVIDNEAVADRPSLADVGQQRLEPP
jgi:hypothetical protein